MVGVVLRQLWGIGVTAGHLPHRAGISQSLGFHTLMPCFLRFLPHVAGTLSHEGEEIAVCLAFKHDLGNSQTSKWQAKWWSSHAALKELLYVFVIRSCTICSGYDPWVWVGLTCLFGVWFACDENFQRRKSTWTLRIAANKFQSFLPDGQSAHAESDTYISTCYYVLSWGVQSLPLGAQCVQFRQLDA